MLSLATCYRLFGVIWFVCAVILCFCCWVLRWFVCRCALLGVSCGLWCLITVREHLWTLWVSLRARSAALYRLCSALIGYGWVVGLRGVVWVLIWIVLSCLYLVEFLIALFVSGLGCVCCFNLDLWCWLFLSVLVSGYVLFVCLFWMWVDWP